jgi:alkylation response protein AidB-like acyl-CoA dehydrogenase
LASGVEAAIVVEALGARVADTAVTGPLLASDLCRRSGVESDPHLAVGFAPSLLTPLVVGSGADGDRSGVAVDSGEATSALVLLDDCGAYRLSRIEVGTRELGTDLTRLVRTLDVSDAEPIAGSRALDGRDLQSFTALGLALTCADLVGTMRGVLDVTVAYATDRRQYGVPVGSFQAVQHLLAEARCLIEGSLSVAAHAAWAVDALDCADAVEAGRVAKAYCARAARTVHETAIQVHGGIGNTWECIVHVFLRRAMLSTQWFGDDGHQLHELQATRLGVGRGFS